MTILWLTLLIVFTLSFFARYYALPVSSPEEITPMKPNKIHVLGAAMMLAVVSGLRSNIGDTFFYAHIYEMNDFTWEFIVSQKDIGFGILQMILKKYSDDPQILIFTTALITNVWIIVILSKYSRLFELSTYIYITGGLYLVSMNGIRQVLAAAIIFAGTKYIINGNWMKYFFIVFVAALFHQSAWIMMPIYFFVRYKAWSVGTLLLLFFAIAIVGGYEYFSTILFSAIENTQYGHYSQFQEGGASNLRVAVYSVPLIIAFLGRHKLRDIFPASDYMANLTLVGLVFMMISTQNWIFARFSIYFSFYQLILISWIVKLFAAKDQRAVYYGILVCYFFYYYYENVITLEIDYQSTFLGIM